MVSVDCQCGRTWNHLEGKPLGTPEGLFALAAGMPVIGFAEVENLSLQVALFSELGSYIKKEEGASRSGVPLVSVLCVF